MVVLTLMVTVAVAGCSAGPRAADAAPSPAGPTATSAAGPTAPSPAGPPSAASPPSPQPSGTTAAAQTMDVSAGCAAGTLRDHLADLTSGDTSVVVGTLRLTDQVVDAERGGPTETLTQVVADIDRSWGAMVQPGPGRTFAVLGGLSSRGIRTVANETVSSDWAVDGRFFGTVHRSPNGIDELSALPVTGDRLALTGVGCWSRTPGDGLTARVGTIDVVRFGGTARQLTVEATFVPLPEVLALLPR
jgi:hypothetical protein